MLWIDCMFGDDVRLIDLEKEQRMAEVAVVMERASVWSDGRYSSTSWGREKLYSMPRCNMLSLDSCANILSGGIPHMTRF